MLIWIFRNIRVVDIQSGQSILSHGMKVSSTHLGVQVVKKGVGTTSKTRIYKHWFNSHSQGKQQI